MSNATSGVAEAIRELGFITYRYLLSDLMPGAIGSVALLYYLRRETGVRTFAADFAFVKDISGGAFLAFVAVLLAFGLGIALNIASDIFLGRLITWKAFARLTISLDRRDGYRQMEDLAEEFLELNRLNAGLRVLNPRMTLPRFPGQFASWTIMPHPRRL